MALLLFSRMLKRAGRSISTSRNISIATVNKVVGRLFVLYLIINIGIGHLSHFSQPFCWVLCGSMWPLYSRFCT